MRADDFLKAFGNIRPEWIEDAEKAGKTVPRWLKWGSIAACLCCVIALSVLRLNQLTTSAEPTPAAWDQPEQTFGVPSPFPSPEQSKTDENAALEDSANEGLIDEDHTPEEEPAKAAADPAAAAEAPNDSIQDAVIPTMADMESGGYLYSFPSTDGEHDIRVWNLFRVPLEDFANWNKAETDLNVDFGNSYPDWETFELLSTIYQVGKDDNYMYLLDITTEILPVLENEHDYISYLVARNTCPSIVSTFLTDNGIKEAPGWIDLYNSEYTLNNSEEEDGYSVPYRDIGLLAELPAYKYTNTRGGLEGEGELITPMDPYTLAKSLPTVCGIAWTVSRKAMTPEELGVSGIDSDIILASTENYTYYLTMPEGQQWLDDPISKANYYNMMKAGKRTIYRFFEINEIETYDDWEAIYDALCMPSWADDPDIQRWIYK